ncbi:hypothetical protein Mapa_015375 [Marchantia paleacea]|nr:hypothetical protein Mapa_015375 [Marchantia paleacea]
MTELFFSISLEVMKEQELIKKFSGLVCRCVITGNGDSKPYMHLGRPWGPHARVVFAYTHMDSCIFPSGWHNWNNTDNEKTACYYEYRYDRTFAPCSKRNHVVCLSHVARTDYSLQRMLEIHFCTVFRFTEQVLW